MLSGERVMIFAEQRSSTTQFELGQMFRKSASGRSDYQKAAEWFKRSAKQGNIEAQYKIGLMYLRGFGVKINYVKAYAWLKVAASQGSKKSLHFLTKIAARIPPSRLAQAQALSHDYYRKFVVPFC